MKDLDALLEPIEGEDPGGEYLRYDPVYDEIKQARHEDPDLPQGEWKRERKVADWAKVVSLASSTLAERSKDLQIAAWLLEGWLRREGFPGLEAGLHLLIRLHKEHWEHLHPRVEDPDDLEFRAVPLEWVGDYLEPALKSAPLNDTGHTLAEYEEARRMGTEEDAAGNADREAAREEAISEGRPVMEDFLEAFDSTPKAWVKEMAGAVEGSREALAQLDETCEELYEDVPPSFMTLRESLVEISRVTTRLLERKLEQDPDPVEEAEPDGEDAGPDAGGEAPGGREAASAAGAPAAGSTSAAASTGRAARAPAPDSPEGAASGIAAAARWMRGEDSTNPAPYLILRAHRWGELRAGGPDLDPRLLEAPPTESRTRLKLLLLDGKWAELLEAAEEVMATPWGRGWIDLQRYVVTALDHLGS
ncbi:MAG: type VI secretion system protein TssA, partial [Gemmatimonadales bacterium]